MRRWLGIAAIALLVLYAGWTKFRPPYVVQVGTPIRHDDFFFTVKQIQHSLQPDGSSLYNVVVNVRNGARAVNYHWRDDIAYVRAFDARGFGHNFYSSAPQSFTLAAGESRDTHMAFALPATVSSPGLYFWDGVFMGDALDGISYAKAVTPLGAYHPPFGT